MTAWARYFGIVAAAMGAVLSALLAAVHAGLVVSPPFTRWVGSSGWAISLWGVPIELLGVAWFGAASLLEFVCLRYPQKQGLCLTLLMVWALPAAGTVLVLWLGAHAGPLNCFACTLVSLLIVIITLRSIVHARPTAVADALRGTALLTGMKRVPSAMILVAISVATVAIVRLDTSLEFEREAAARSDAATSDAVQWFAGLRRVPVAVTSKAAITIVRFQDYQCPACRHAYFTYDAVMAEFTRKNGAAVALVDMDFPLDSSCNDTVRQTIHPHACEAAATVKAVTYARLDFRAVTKRLYENQETLTPESIAGAAAAIGWPGDTDLKSHVASALEDVRKDISTGKALGVSSTPTIFINGAKIVRVLDPDVLRTILEYELKRVRAVR